MGHTILGFDPGFAHLGYAALEIRDGAYTVRGLGIVETKKSAKKRSFLASDDNLRRAREIAECLDKLVSQYNPSAIACESMSFVRNASACQKIGIAWGVLAAVAELSGSIPILKASPQDVKLRVCGDRTASKLDVQNALISLFGDGVSILWSDIPSGKREHCADALAVILAVESSDVVRLLKSDGKLHGR